MPPLAGGYAGEIPPLPSFLYLRGDTADGPPIAVASDSGATGGEAGFGRSRGSRSLLSQAAPRTGPGGEFDWGGTSVKA